MHLHAYSKANYQTNIQIPYAILHKLYLALVFKLGSRNRSFGDEWETKTEEEQQNNVFLRRGEDCKRWRLVHGTKSSVHSVTDLGQNTILAEVDLSRLGGLERTDHRAVNTGSSEYSENKEFDVTSAQQHRLATQTVITERINRESTPPLNKPMYPY